MPPGFPSPSRRLPGQRPAGAVMRTPWLRVIVWIAAVLFCAGVWASLALALHAAV